jgi:hypothetical protein
MQHKTMRSASSRSRDAAAAVWALSVRRVLQRLRQPLADGERLFGGRVVAFQMCPHALVVRVARFR